MWWYWSDISQPQDITVRATSGSTDNPGTIETYEINSLSIRDTSESTDEPEETIPLHLISNG